METKLSSASLRYFRVAPRKMSLLADEVRGKVLLEALQYLEFSPRKRVALALAKLLRSAAAQHEPGALLQVQEILVGQGPTLKRFRARAKGSGTRINKKTSHVTVRLASSGNVNRLGKLPEASSPQEKAQEKVEEHHGSEG